MAEHPELLGLVTEIVSAHVRNNAVAADQLPRLIQQVFNALATVEQGMAHGAEGRTSRAREEVSVGGSHRLSRLRQAFLHAAATSDDRP